MEVRYSSAIIYARFNAFLNISGVICANVLYFHAKNNIITRRKTSQNIAKFVIYTIVFAINQHVYLCKELLFFMS